MESGHSLATVRGWSALVHMGVMRAGARSLRCLLLFTRPRFSQASLGAIFNRVAQSCAFSKGDCVVATAGLIRAMPCTMVAPYQSAASGVSPLIRQCGEWA